MRIVPVSAIACDPSNRDVFVPLPSTWIAARVGTRGASRVRGVAALRGGVHGMFHLPTKTFTPGDHLVALVSRKDEHTAIADRVLTALYTATDLTHVESLENLFNAVMLLVSAMRPDDPFDVEGFVQRAAPHAEVLGMRGTAIRSLAVCYPATPPSPRAPPAPAPASRKRRVVECAFA